MRIFDLYQEKDLILNLLEGLLHVKGNQRLKPVEALKLISPVLIFKKSLNLRIIPAKITYFSENANIIKRGVLSYISYRVLKHENR